MNVYYEQRGAGGGCVASTARIQFVVAGGDRRVPHMDIRAMWRYRRGQSGLYSLPYMIYFGATAGCKRGQATATEFIL
jgi:hypothetical protein